MAAISPDAIASVVSYLPVTYGALLLASFLGFMLYGLFLHQTYQYFRRFSTDPPYIKIMVTPSLPSSRLLETVHLLMTGHLCYSHLVTSYFNPTSLLVGGCSSFHQVLPVISAVTIIVSQIFSIRRVSLIGPRQAMIAVMVVSAKLRKSCLPICVSIFSLIATVVAFTRPTSLLLGAVSIVVARLYGNTLLAILNSRQLRGMELFAGESVAISIARAKREASQDLWSTPRVPQSEILSKIDIQVTTEMEGRK
ncbi:hypothetical protein LXA43DRAFT_1168973 [Ganoderma leucocontextum]|nr:hypothetical protein LXA43DRAFT_1168973 [Ganoderma leucocontextum]